MTISPDNPFARQTPEIPGHTEAQRLGYTLHSSNGTKTKATYTKATVNLPATLHLTVFFNQQGVQGATLEAFTGMVRHSIEQFSFPNVNFPLFEKQLTHVLEKLA